MKTALAVATVIFVLSAAMISGCGKVKNKDDVTVKVKSTAPSTTEEDIRSAAEAVDFLAGDSHRYNANELESLAIKIRPVLEKLVGVSGLPIEALIDAVTQLFPQARHEGVTAGDVVREMHRHLIFLKWFRGVRELSLEQLTQKIKTQYPGASETSVTGLSNAMMRQDRKWVGGDESAAISRAEMVLPILLLSGVEWLDFSQGLPTEVNGLVLTKLVVDQIETKMDQQVFGRFGDMSHKSIGAVSLKLETMAILIKAFQVKQLVDFMKAGDGVAPAQMQEALNHITGRTDAEAIELSKLYDIRVLGGDGDSHLSAVELFQLATDIEFAGKVLAFPDKVFKSSQTLIALDKAGRKFDPKADITKTTLDVTAAKITDLAFRLYDVDKDGFLTKDEVRPLFKRMGVKDKSSISAFFSDVGLSDKKVTIITKTKFIFKQVITLGGPDKLNNVDFVSRLMKILPRLLDNETGEEPAHEQK